MYQGDEWPTDLDCGDLVLTSHWRLQDIQTTRAYMKAPSPDESIDSLLSPIDPYILLVPPHRLGTHEKTIGRAHDPSYIPNGYFMSGFSDIFLSNGWHGPAVAVAAKTRNIYESITRELSRKGKIGLLEDIDYGDLGILDGHHRSEMAKTMGFKFIPVQLIPFPHNPAVFLGTHHNDGKIWKAEQVLACFDEPDWHADPKRTKFQMMGLDGIPRRIRNLQPLVHVPVSSLK